MGRYEIIYFQKRGCYIKTSSSICRTWVPGSRKKCNIRWRKFIWWRKQRLSLARLLLRDSADIWILDEPTTALDLENTTKTMNLIEASSKTLVIATHDLDVLPRFDKIIVMIDGEIKESGSYESLLEGNGYLSQMIEINHSSKMYINSK